MIKRILLALAFLAALPAAAAAPRHPLSVAIVWHQHQPFYPKLPRTGLYTQPWVRLHAVKDYIRMAETAAKYPGVKVTINLTPSLLAQLDDYSRGATDRAMDLSTVAAILLSSAEKSELSETFFFAGPALMAPFPGYLALKVKPRDRYTVEDWRDLQTYFNLAWLAPEVRREPRMAALVRKGGRYTENDKAIVLARHNALVRQVIPTHVRLERQKRLEVSTTPYAHPILPLLVDSRVAAPGLPDMPMPRPFRRPEDARDHLDLATAAFERYFNHPPSGMWPAEGAVSQAVMPLFKEAGIAWVATDEAILARTLGATSRRSDRLTRPDDLTTPWRAQDGPAVLFRHHLLSDLVGLEYHSWEGKKAANDFIGRMRAIAAKVDRRQPRLLAVILDGENAWEAYPDNGEAFLNALYAGLSGDSDLVTVSPGDFFGKTKTKPLPGPLAAGTSVDGTFGTWIGEPDENFAWDALGRARDAVAVFEVTSGRGRSWERAMVAIRAAEGSDWFWWYGKDQDSGHDGDFDRAFRSHLETAYRAIGHPLPEEILRPIGPKTLEAVRPDRPISPAVDGKGGPSWKGAFEVRRSGRVMQTASRPIQRVQLGHDGNFLYVAVDFSHETDAVGLSLGFAGRIGGVDRPGLPFSEHARGLFRHGLPGSLRLESAPPADAPVRTAWTKRRVEAAIPWTALHVRGGEDLSVSVLELNALPFPDLPIHFQVPALPDRSVLVLSDPAGDGVGGRYDLIRFSIEDSGLDWAFVWTMSRLEVATRSFVPLGPVVLDAYATQATDSEVPKPLLPGRRGKSRGPWDFAVTVNGQEPGLYKPGGFRIVKARVVIEPRAGRVSAMVPKRLLPGSPGDWGILTGVLERDDKGPSQLRNAPFLDILGSPSTQPATGGEMPFVRPPEGSSGPS